MPRTLTPLLLALMTACAPEDTGLQETPGDTASPTTHQPFSQVSATRSDAISTVFTVRWTSDGDGPGAVSFGHDDVHLGQVSADPLGDGRWEAVLVGVPPETEAWYQLADGESVESELRGYTTGPGPDWWPDAREPVGEGDDGFVALGLRLNADDFYSVIVNAVGEPVWWMENQGAAGERSSRVALSLDRKSVLWNTFHIKEPDGPRDGGFFVASLDGEQVDFVSAPMAHHDFWQHDDGTLTYPAYEFREVDGRDIGGDLLVERAPDGSERTLWSSWDTHDFVQGESREDPIGFYTIANQVFFDDAADAYWLSVRNVDAILKFDRSSGELLWQLGGDDGDFQLDSPFAGQHGFEVLGGELLVHDNSAKDTLQTRIARYDLDEQEMTAELLASYTYDDDYYTAALGDALALDNGNILAVWSAAAEIQELAPDGTVVRSFGWDGPVHLGFAHHYDSLVR